MIKKMTLRELSLSGQKVLMRVDFNVPLKKGQIQDDERLVASLDSIRYVLSKGASVVLMSHLGRPKGKEADLSLAPVAKRLQELLKQEVIMASDCIGPKVAALQGKIILLENLRFYPEEEANDAAFAKQLAALGTCYVDDAFGSAHRAHASTVGVPKLFPRAAAMGFLMEKEIQALTPLLHNPPRPFYAIIGGAKISTKIGVIKNLLPKIDRLFLGGAMAYPFFKAQGIQIGNSLCEEVNIRDLPLDKIVLPSDVVITNKQEVRTISIREGIPPGWQGMDIGPKTVADWKQSLEKGATLFWNGPVGVFEEAAFAKGTNEIASILASCKGQTVVGGGDSLAALKQAGLSSKIGHLSTGGGASLEFLEFGHLPGIDALTIRDSV